MSVDLSVDIGALRLATPIMPASGTFAEGLESLIPFDRLGALVTKTITAELRGGNPTPRVAETASGMLNAIGIPSNGVDEFLKKTIPFYRRFEAPLVVSVSAPTVEGFAQIAQRLDLPEIAAIEANISCPNIEEDGKAFAMEAHGAARVVERLRAATRRPLWVKLTPNAGDIVSVARACEAAGADALVVGNTILAMAIDVETFRPRLGNVMGGLSGPAVKPIMVRMTYQCAKAVRIPVIGCGGASTAQDAVEFMLAGASAVQVGTATFLQPTCMIEMIEGLADFCARKKIGRVRELTGALRDAGMALHDLASAP